MEGEEGIPKTTVSEEETAGAAMVEEATVEEAEAEAIEIARRVP